MTAAAPPAANAMEIFSPVDGQLVGWLPMATADEVAEAVRTAVRSQPGWARTPVTGRTAAVSAVADGASVLVGGQLPEDSGAYYPATVLTGSMAHAQRAWRALPVGTVKINAVFGGAPGGAAQPRAGSGSGYGYGPELLDELTTTKVVHRQPPGGGA